MSHFQKIILHIYDYLCDISRVEILELQRIYFSSKRGLAYTCLLSFLLGSSPEDDLDKNSCSATTNEPAAEFRTPTRTIVPKDETKNPSLYFPSPFFSGSMAQTQARVTTPPPETQIEYTKKARHGHGQDVVDENNIRQVAGCLPIDPVNKRFLLVSSRKNPGAWVIVSYRGPF